MFIAFSEVNAFAFFLFVSGLILFAGLAIGLGIGAIAEVAKKNFKPPKEGDTCFHLFWFLTPPTFWL